jgi:hypothetical protein
MSVLDQFAGVSTDVLSMLDTQLAVFSGAALAAAAALAREAVVVDDLDDAADAQVHKATPARDRVLFYKMKADTHRYLAELAPADPRLRAASSFPADAAVEADCALSAYKIATSLAEAHLAPCAPLRLLLALNFSTFYCDVRHSLRMATHVAKQSYEAACETVHSLGRGRDYDDAVRVLQLIRDNISAWSLALATGGGHHDQSMYSSDDDSDVDVREDWDDDDGDGDNVLLEDDDVSFVVGEEQRRAFEAATGAGVKILGSGRASGSDEGSGNGNGNSRKGRRTKRSRAGAGASEHRGIDKTSRHAHSTGGLDTQNSAGELVSKPLGIVSGSINPSASAPVLAASIKGHGRRALKTSPARPDSPGLPRSAKPSRSRRSSKTKNMLMQEGPVPSDHIESLLRGAVDVLVSELEDDSAGGSLSQALFEIFHSYLEGDSGTPVAAHLANGSTGALEATILLLKSQSTGLRLTVDALVRMMRDFGIVPKLMNAPTVRALASAAAEANTEGVAPAAANVVLVYENKLDLNSSTRRKRPAGITIKKVKDHTPPNVTPPSSAGSTRSSTKDGTNSRTASGRRSRSQSGDSRSGDSRPNSAGSLGSSGSNPKPTVHWIDFTEFVDAIGRVAVVAYKLNPGAFGEPNINRAQQIIESFFRHKMMLYSARTLEEDAAWRKLVRRPWEAHATHKRITSPKAMSRPPLPGQPHLIHQRSALLVRQRSEEVLLDSAANKGSLLDASGHEPVPAVKDPRLPDFVLTASGYRELNDRRWIRSLRQIFDFYRKINTVLKKQKSISSGSTGGNLFSDIGGMNQILTLSDFIKFFSDFKIVPRLLKQDLVQDIFQTATRKAKRKSAAAVEGSKKDGRKRGTRARSGNSVAGGGDGVLHNRPSTAPLKNVAGAWSLMGATWEVFLDCIGRCAIAADFDPARRKYVGDVAKIRGFMVTLELDEGGDWRKMMRSYGSPSRSPKLKKQASRELSKITGMHGARKPFKSPARGVGLRAVRAAKY